MLKFKIDVLLELKQKGFSTYRLRKDKLLSEDTKRYIKLGVLRGAESLNTICKLLDCQPGDILEYVPDTNK